MNILRRVFLARSVTAGATLYVTMRWFDRAVGVLSTIVLARLLTPDDFGIVALTTIVIGLTATVLDFGVNIRVVQMPAVDEKDLDTAWTVRLIQNLLIAAALAASAPLVAGYYEDVRLTPVLQVLAATTVLGSFSSMCVVVFQKRREYAREVTFVMTKRFATFVATVGLAFEFRDYWALVYGSVFSAAFGVGLSYWMEPVLRRPALVRWRKFFGASIWLTLRSIGIYASQQVDKLFVGKISGSTSLGVYTLGDQIAAMPSTELLAPMNRALFPLLSENQAEPLRLRGAFLRALGLQLTLAIPALIGLSLTSHEVVHALLGEKWATVAPVLSLLAIAYGIASLSSSFGYLLLAAGRFRAQAAATWLNSALLVALFVWFSQSLDIEGAATIRIVCSVVLSFALIWLALRDEAAAIHFVDCAAVAWRPLVAAGIMAAMVLVAESIAVDFRNVAVVLVGKIVVGVFSYVLVLLSLWVLAGKPEGAETWLLGLLQKVFARHPVSGKPLDNAADRSA